ncbi:MAG: hypothetical protein SGI71_03565 [Verrucomicrobiota bacterium]|nr:hypothetical protein [Verrucomicrobiota bacterium]
MNGKLFTALALIFIIFFVLLGNTGGSSVNLIFMVVKAKAAIVFLGFFLTGLVTGILLKGK